MIEQSETSTRRRTTRMIRGYGVITLLFWIVSAAATAIAQHGSDAVTETVTTHRDLNGRDVVNEKVVTRISRTDGEERVVIDTYSPSMEAGRLALTERINRVTTVTRDGSRTVEETVRPSHVSPGDPPRVVRKIVTTTRKSGSDSYVSEREVFEQDVDGRLVLVRGQTERVERN